MKQEEVIGKIVVNTKAEKLGEVKNVAYDSLGGKSMIVSSPDGPDKIYPFDRAVAIKDVVLLDENKTLPTLPRHPEPSQIPPSSVTTPANMQPPIPRFPPSSVTVAASTMKTCRACGRQNRLESKFCGHCGNPF